MNKEIYKEAYKELLSRLKKCGNLTTQEYFDENTGEKHIRRSYHLIQIIEDYMCEILEEQIKEALSTKCEDCGQKLDYYETNQRWCLPCYDTKYKGEQKDILKGLGRGENKYDIGFEDGLNTKSTLCEVCEKHKCNPKICRCRCHIKNEVYNTPSKKEVKVDSTIDTLINKFITKWCGNMSAHLLDSDENDGEELRNNLKDLFNSQEKPLKCQNSQEPSSFRRGISKDNPDIHSQIKESLDKDYPKAVILDDNPLSIAMYMEDHPEIAEKLFAKDELDKDYDKSLDIPYPRGHNWEGNYIILFGHFSDTYKDFSDIFRLFGLCCF